ncbi:hypothetical protein GCM10022245_45340 [Streptomyces mayteni]
MPGAVTVGSGTIRAAAGTTLMNMATNACLDDSGDYGLRAYPCNNSSFQMWRLEY